MLLELLVNQEEILMMIYFVLVAVVLFLRCCVVLFFVVFGVLWESVFGTKIVSKSVYVILWRL